jgi:2'-5' RNA ligase
MARLRTFIAVDLGKAIRDRCVALQETLASTAEGSPLAPRAGADSRSESATLGRGGGVKWVEEENLHVTLLFLGEVEDREVPALCRAVADCCAGHDAFALSVEGVGCFPNPRRPRTVWVGVGVGGPELCALHDALEPPLLALGCYRREDRQYTPHVTLGRVKGDRPADKLAAALARQARWRGGQTEVRELRVLNSELTPQGPVYTVLSRARLRNPARPGRGAQEEE